MTVDITKVDLLSKADGYGVLFGVGAAFAIGIVFATRLMNKYLHENSESTEMFMVCNRTVGIGLTASAVYSSWTWATELLWCVTMVYYYGVQSSYWYAAGLSVHITILAVVGIEAKKKIPTGHTCLEIIKIRYGTVAHILYIILCLINNIVSCSSMVLGTAGAISILCDNIHIVCSSIMIPVAVMAYSVVGGLKATFLTDQIHSLILLIVLAYVCTKSLVSIGGLDTLYNLVREKELNGTIKYIEGNYKGSYLTGKSQGAIFFGLIHAIGDMGLTIMDQSFWQKSFSANIKSTVPGYLIAAVLIYANVWALGTIVGLSNVVLEDTPIFPTWPNKMTSYEINSGYGLLYTLKALCGNGALGGILIALYLACTSTVSAQMISVSSIFSFDIYKTYLKKHATNNQMMRISHLGVIGFGFFIAGFAIMLYYVVDLTWFAYFYSMLNCPGVIPMILSITWKKQSKLAFIVSPIVGMIGGLVIWTCSAYALYGEVTLATTGEQLPCLYGGLTALFLPGILSLVISLIKPDNYDWNELKEQSQLIETDSEEDADEVEIEEFTDSKKPSHLQVKLEHDTELLEQDIIKNDRLISLYIKIAWGSAIFVLLLTWVVWPLPLYRDYIWSLAFFKGYTVVGLIWVYLALIIIGLYPYYDGRHSLRRVFLGVLGKLPEQNN